MCQTYTTLSQQQIDHIIQLAEQLPRISKLNRAYVFIDCYAIEADHLIVVAEALPKGDSSLYQNSVVTQNVYESFEPAVFQALTTGKDVHEHRGVTQEGKVVEQNVTPIILNGETIGALIMEKDITQQIANEQKLTALSKATETISELFKQPKHESIFVPDMIEESLFYLDKSYLIRYFNLKGEQMVEALTSETCELNLSFLKYFPRLHHILNDERVIVLEERAIYDKYYQVKCIKLYTDTHVSGYLMMFKDITELKEKEKALISKTVAIREVHHRVKNNLQTVASLLRLQMRMGIPEESQYYFKESLNRILCIASVYEVILSESDVDQVNIGTLIQKIGNMLVANESSDIKTIQIDYHLAERYYLPSHIAIAIALIANELITNCLNHAFTAYATGEIEVRLTYDQQSQAFTLMIQDNGTGASSYQKSFGLNIVNTITENDLDGHFTIKSNTIGTLAQIVFQYKGSIAI
ncbi:sensor histidine kinase [Staphylococcus arlettae]|uniref:sensor histidine kinase n=1 Tax=Staphylococcus arlettae TaxID=29378 RepID=UPI001CA79044|nr:sensor histidine kinase [Staphylococcus arlettae]QZZ04701.1 sensor histidine kinase [Staphylococcus arlettae]